MGANSDTPVDNEVDKPFAGTPLDVEKTEAELARQAEILSKELPEQYELLARVSEGGMGAIFKARNRHTDALYAIKILHPECSDNEEMHKRFILEAKVASALKHPNICQFHDFGITASGTSYLVMEWINGLNLQRKVMRDGPLSVEEALVIFRQIAAALEYAHSNKLVHRDLKPDNIMLSRGGPDRQTIVHIVDFGIAKQTPDEQSISRAKGLTQTGMIVGTPLYMSPEQARAMDVDQRSDVYSFGCLMYFALSGEPPFYGDSILDTMYAHVSKEVSPFDPKLKIPDALAMIVYKAMEKEPADRYQDMRTLGGDLRKVDRGITVEHRALARDRISTRNKLIKIGSFVVGFLIMYAISIAIQGLLGAVAPEPKVNQEQSPQKVPAQGQAQSNAPKKSAVVPHKSKKH
jgi:eukaryotic-like serine/threonine-protein kinase